MARLSGQEHKRFLECLAELRTQTVGAGATDVSSVPANKVVALAGLLPRRRSPGPCGTWAGPSQSGAGGHGAEARSTTPWTCSRSEDLPSD